MEPQEFLKEKQKGWSQFMKASRYGVTAVAFVAAVVVYIAV